MLSLSHESSWRCCLTQTIAPETTIGEISIFVSDLARSVAFYQERLGFQLLEQAGGQVVFGAGEKRLLNLIEKSGAQRARGVTGLYHFAVLLPERRELAKLLYHLAQTGTEVQGASDHGVSEALYLADPDGNGIELYRDRRRAEWPTDDIGRLMMDTDELDIDDLILELRNEELTWGGLPAGTVIGHVHLHVRDLSEAEVFYTRVLGFQLMQRYGSGALFVSAGGYHHHIGLNTWAGAGAPPPPADAVGLNWFEVRLPDSAALEVIRARLDAAQVPYEMAAGGLLARDPSRNGILFRA
jgi:catechol 2,3-dioxygenase